MMPILEKIPLNGCDASETLSPPGMGGDICSACDHFFHAPVENLLAFARAGRECGY